MKKTAHHSIDIPAGSVMLPGELDIPEAANAIIIFSHGSGSSRLSERNQKVARYLREKGWGTLLFDLLTLQEDRTYYTRFNIDLLSKRLIAVTRWLEQFIKPRLYPIGYFGASTGAASALKASIELPQVAALVCRGGRPDLVMDILPKVTAPTLLIVGGLDPIVLPLNETAFHVMQTTKKLVVIEGATHLFSEKGKMEKVGEEAERWFSQFLISIPEIH